MAFYRFREEDIVNTKIATFPSYVVELNGDQVTGSIFLEKKYLNDSLLNRRFQGFSDKEGGFVEKDGPFSSSIDLFTAVSGGTNKEDFETIRNLYDFYSVVNIAYAPEYTGSFSPVFRVISIPEIYYDREVLTGSFTASDLDAAGATRSIYDNGRGGLYSGSLSGTLVGHLFYSEGLAVLTKGDLSNFGSVSSTNFKWRINFKGTHQIPVKIFRCRAPAGQLNASTNATFHQIPAGSAEVNKNEKEIVLDENITYITTIGLYNDDYELVGMARISQPIKKEEKSDIQFRVRMDF